MAAAIEAGIPKLRIEEAAARTQARIDSGRQPVIGVNKFRPDDGRRRSTCSRSTTPRCAPSRSPSCERLRAERDAGACEAALDALTAAARASVDGTRAPGLEQNLLELAVDAARAQATVGEISDALRRSSAATPRRSVRSPGVYRDEVGESPNVGQVRALVDAFAERARPAAAHPGRQDGPGRPRPRPEGDRHGVRRPRLRRRRRPAVPDARARSPARPSRPTCTSSACPRSPPATSRWCPQLQGELARARPRRHHDRRRRRHPAAGLRRAARGRRGGDLPARHGDRRRRRRAARRARSAELG